MDIFSFDEGPVSHGGGILFKVTFQHLTNKDQVDDVESNHDLLSTREAFDRLFGIDPNMTVEELEDSKQMRETHFNSRRNIPAFLQQNLLPHNEAVSGASGSIKRKRSISQQPQDAQSGGDGDLDLGRMLKVAKGCGAVAPEHQAD